LICNLASQVADLQGLAAGQALTDAGLAVAADARARGVTYRMNTNLWLPGQYA